VSSAGESAIVLSVVVPVKDEEESLSPLHREITAALMELGVPSEIVYVDDGSTDGSAGVLRSLAQQDPRVRVGSLDRNYGQSTAMIAGAEMARGEWVATLDADGQNDPADLPRLWQARLATGADAVQGVRRQRHDSWIRKVSSRIANTTRDLMTGDRITDVGCSLRIVRRSTLLAAPRFEGMHRFLPTLLRMTGATIVEEPISHRPRRAGFAKYGIHNRLWRALYDLVMIRRLNQRWIRYRWRESSERSAAGRGESMR
jgi:dolichol-phosphate mannosyltransferase